MYLSDEIGSFPFNMPRRKLYLDLFHGLTHAFYSIEILNEWYLYQHDGIHTGTAVIRTVFFFNQIINKIPIDCFINQSQHMVLRYHVVHGKHHHLFSFFICIFRHHKKHRPSDIYYIRKAVPTIAKPCKSRALSTV